MLRNTPLINAQVDMHAHNYCTEECMCMYNYNEHPRIGTHLGPKLHFLIGITTFCSQLCIIVVASWLKVILAHGFLNQGVDQFQYDLSVSTLPTYYWYRLELYCFGS